MLLESIVLTIRSAYDVHRIEKIIKAQYHNLLSPNLNSHPTIKKGKFKNKINSQIKTIIHKNVAFKTEIQRFRHPDPLLVI